MKKNIKLFLVLILSFAFLPVIFAESTVKINGGIDNIYDGGSGSATFDNTTNTLTLNGYSGESILFEGFNGETVNVVVKGTNTIEPSGTPGMESVALGFEFNSTETVTMNVTGEDGSKLYLMGYYDGIHLGYGDLYIKNLDLNLSSVSYVGIHAHNGKLFINDSVFEADNCGYVVDSDGEGLYIDNLRYSSSNTQDYDFYTYGQFNLSNSKVVVENGGFFSWSLNANIENSDIDYKGVSSFNSDELSIKDSNVKIETIQYALGLYKKFNIDNSDVLLKSDMAALLISIAGETTDGIVNLKNVKLETKDVIYGLAKTNIFYLNNCVSYFTEEPTEVYEEATLDNLIGIAAKELHFVPDEEIENPQTADSIWVYVITAIISLTGILMSLFLKKRYN